VCHSSITRQGNGSLDGTAEAGLGDAAAITPAVGALRKVRLLMAARLATTVATIAPAFDPNKDRTGRGTLSSGGQNLRNS
jgi:hypothetical protein